tara:strand:- start:139 stop:795 length:657 start_codon:yes stop_codon:yes gene_type:complete
LKTVKIIILVLSLFYSSYGQQQDSLIVSEEPSKTHTLSFSALWGMFGLIHANYGRVIDGGDKEYQIMFGTFGYEDDFSEAEQDGDYINGYLYGVKGASGVKGSYRKYRNGEAKGLFYQAHMRLLNYSWGYKIDGGSWKDVNTFAYQPSLVLGYKYHPPVLNKRIFVELFAGAGYSYDNPEDGDVKLMFLDDEDDLTSGYEAGSNEFGPDFNIYIGFTF